MKKYALLINAVLLLVLVACSKESRPTANEAYVTNSRNAVSSKDLLEYFVNNKGINPTKAADISVEPIRNGRDTVMFLINYQDGWEVLSGDIRAPRVLIKCKSGHMTLEELNGNPAQCAFISALSTNLKAARYDDLLDNEDIQDSWDKKEVLRDGIFDHYVLRILTGEEREVIDYRLQDHLLTTTWGQGSPWNQYAPYRDSTMTRHCPTGCTPVAVAQTLYYLHNKIGAPASVYGSASCSAYAPTNGSIILTSSDVTFSNSSPANWGMMALNQSNESGADKVSALMVYLGYLYNASYWYNTTSAVLSNSTSIFPSYFGLTCQLQYRPPLSWLKNVTNNQIYDNEFPIMMSVSDNYWGGHAIVLDGFKYIKESVTRYYDYYITGPDGQIQPGQQPDSSDSTTTEEESWYVAINWGWNGSWNNDSNSGETIWYNIEAAWLVSIYDFSQFNYIVYNFAVNNT